MTIIRVSTLAALAATSLLSFSAQAMNINLTTAAAIDNKISFGYAVFARDANNPNNVQSYRFSTDGIAVKNIQPFMAAMNNALANIRPDKNIDGTPSTITVGYEKKDGTQVFPATCTNIPASMQMNIFMDEAGCTVS